MGCYEISKDNADLPVLINAEHLHDGPHEVKVDASYVTNVIIENNDIKKLKALNL